MPRRSSTGSPARPEAFTGDEILPDANVVMNRHHMLPGSVDDVWPWIEQLGRGRAGWYLPGRLERWLPGRFHALRDVDPSLQLAVGEVVPDYGPAHFVVAQLNRPFAVVYRASWGRRRYTWALLLTPVDSAHCLLHSRFRLDKGGAIARTLGDTVDRITIGLMARGLTERLRAAGRRD